MKVKVKDLLKNVEIVKLCNISNKEFENLSVLSVNDNTQSSKLKNSLFVLIKGFSFDSHIEAENLAKKGVKFFVSEQKLNISAAYVIVKNTRKALSFICGNFYKNSIQKMKLICVLGTNGKTTTTYIIKGLLEFLKVKCGVIGTSGVFIGSKKLKETLTTPDPALLNKLFYEMYKANCKVVIIEVSAHAIALNKIDNLQSDVSVFTNFSQDHLDFFKTMENYKHTKFKFFLNNTKNAVINIDDKAGAELYKLLQNKVKCRYVSLNQNKAIKVKTKINKTIINFKDNLYEFNLPFKFNLYNLFCAIESLKLLGFDEKSILNNISKIKQVEGRFNTFKLKDKTLIIDYAHTPESLKSVLQNVKKLSKKPITVVFGCPGNRDETKREIMGKIASNYSSFVVITSDNPKYENPLKICNQILKGTDKNKSVIIENRKLAIKYAIKNSKKNAIILIIGKGCENYQDINGIKVRYSDIKFVKSLIKRKNDFKSL